MDRKTEVDYIATILEWEHALEHVAECAMNDRGCRNLAQSALDRRNKEDFTEIASDFLKANDSDG